MIYLICMTNQIKGERLLIVATAVTYLLILSGVAAILGMVISRNIEQRVDSSFARMQRIGTLPSRVEPSASSNFSIKFTAARYPGNFAESDPQAGNAICNTTYPGYSFCDSAILDAAGGSLPDPIAYINPFIGGWINIDAKDPSLNCDYWRSADPDKKGSRLFANGSTASRWWILSERDKSCNTELPLCCYK